MTPAQDLMERLTAADPGVDADHLSPDQHREANALLERLLATPVEERRAGPRRRWPLFAIATGVAALALSLALSLSSSDDGPTPNVLAKAVAALSHPDAVYHAEIIPSIRSTEFPEGAPKIFYETWHTNSGRLHWRTYALREGGRGRLLDDFAGQRRPGRLGGPALRYDAGANLISESGFGAHAGGKGAPGVDPFDPVRGLKESQAGGRLKVAGEVEIRGRRAYRLVSGTVKGFDGSVERSEIIVDAETYLPREQRLFVRNRLGKTRVVWHYVAYQRLPLNEKTSELLDFDPPRRAKCAPGTEHQDHKGSLGFPNPCAR
jgi:hypothetical protein